jgi:hypothetical protein
MATIDIGKLSFTHKGDYDGSTAYVLNDVVYYNGSAYIAKTSTTGNLPTSTAHWNQFSAGSGGIWNSGLALGSAGKILQVNSGATALEFTDKPQGAIVQMKQVMYNGFDNLSNRSYVAIPNFNLTITPTASNSSFWIIATIHAGHSNNDSMSGFNIFDSQVGTSNGNEIFPNGQTAGSRKQVFATGKFGLNSVGSVNNYINWQTNISALYTPTSNNANARTFHVCEQSQATTTYMNNSLDNSTASSTTVSNMIVCEIANGIYS